MRLIQLGAIDYAILLVYFAFVLGIGWALRATRHEQRGLLPLGPLHSGLDHRARLPLGQSRRAGSDRHGGVRAPSTASLTSHFYWVGAIPAMVFVGLFMMPFYYGSRARSVPEYLKLRFDEKTRALNAIIFAVMTVFSSGISMYAHGASCSSLLLGWNFDVSVVVCRP